MISNTKQTSRLEMRDLILLTILIGIFFAFMLGNRPLSAPDEGRYVEIPREMVVTGDYLTPRLNGVKYFEKPVLFYWLEAFSIKLLGLDEFTLRLWPAIMALLGCLSVAVAGARLFGRLTGILAAAILATSLLYYVLSRTIILDLPVSILMTIALLSFLIGTHQPTGLKRRLYLWGFFACSALAVLTKGLIGVFIPGMVIGAWILLLGEWRIVKTLYLPSGLVLFLLIAAPWHIMVGRANPEFFSFYFIHEHFARFMTNVHGRYQPVWFFIPVLLLGLFPWSVFLVQAVNHSIPSSWRERHEHRDALFLILWVGLVFTFFSVSSSKLVPYILPVFPPLALLIGRYCAASWDRRDFPGIRAGYVVLMIVALAFAAALFLLPYFRLPISADLGKIPLLGPWAVIIALTLAAGTVMAWGFAHYRGFRHAFIALTITSSLFLIEGNAAAPLLDVKSVKSLALTLKARLEPGDDVVTYQNYNQDLPVYLEKRIIVADWKGELEFGTKVENTSQWIIDATTFWKKWDGPSTMYMVIEIRKYDWLSKNPKLKLCPVAQNSRYILLVNKDMKEVKP
jgi:4-amino-4-deoxy-L-arabinose transferase-like glycosyltransferase